MNYTQKEVMFKIRESEQIIEQLLQQHQAIEESLIDLNSIFLGLNEISKSLGKEILAPIGKGIFLKAKISSEDLTVNVGGNNFVKRDIPETQKIIEGQIKKLEIIKEEIEMKIKTIDEELTQFIIKEENNSFEE